MLRRALIREIAEWSTELPNRFETEQLCSMALALLDVAELVPGDGDVVERVRKELNDRRRDIDAMRDAEDRLLAAQKRIAALETELNECDDLRAKLAALAAAAEKHRNAWRYPSPATADRAATGPRLDAAIAAAREALK